MRFIFTPGKAYSWLAISLGIGLLSLGIVACSTSTAFMHRTSLPHLLKVIEMPEEDSTTQIAVQQGGYAYILNESTDSIAVLDGPNLVTLMRIEAQETGVAVMRDIVAHPQTGLVYVADVLQGIHVIQGTEIITTITDPHVERKFDVLAVHPRTGYVYAGGFMVDEDTQEGFGNIRVISGTRVLADIVGGKTVNSLTPDPSTSRIYAGRSFRNRFPGTSLVSVIDGVTEVMTTTLGYELVAPELNGVIRDIIISPVSDELYLLENLGDIVFWDDTEIERVNLRMEHGPVRSIGWDPTREILYAGIQDSPYALAIQKDGSLHKLRVVAGSYAFVYDATHDYIYTADYNGPSMSVIRGTQVLTTLSTGGRGPRDIGVDEARGYIYVSNADSHSIVVFGYDDVAPAATTDAATQDIPLQSPLTP